MTNAEKEKHVKALAKMEADIVAVGQKYRDLGVINDDRLVAFKRSAKTTMHLLVSMILN